MSDRLAECDLILAEGVASKKVNLLTRSYRVVRKIKRMGLVTQQEGMKVSGFRDRIIRADMEGRAFDGRWAALPLSLRAQLFFLVPAYAAYLFFFGTRETLAENIALDDLPSSDEIMLLEDSADGTTGWGLMIYLHLMK